MSEQFLRTYLASSTVKNSPLSGVSNTRVLRGSTTGISGSAVSKDATAQIGSGRRRRHRRMRGGRTYRYPVVEMKPYYKAAPVFRTAIPVDTLT